MIKLFTHTDLDGYGCALVARHFLGSENVDVSYCQYGTDTNSLNYKLKEFMSNRDHEKFDIVYITDLSPSEEVADMIQQTMSSKVIMLDHHDSAKTLATCGKYPWAQVITHKDSSHLSCATWLLYDYFQKAGQLEEEEDLEKIFLSLQGEFLSLLVEKIRRYDTWEWKRIYLDKEAEELNMLFYLYGGPVFVNVFLERIGSYSDENVSIISLFTPEEKFLLKWDRERSSRIINSISSSKIYKMEFFGHNVAVAFSDSFSSELGNKICEDHPDIDIAVIISPSLKVVSFRTTRTDIHLGEFAKKFGGGGHPQAAGCQFDNDVIQNMIEIVFNDMLSKSEKIINNS